MRPGALEIRVKEQAKLLDQAARFAKPGGKIAYVSCSLLDAENGAQLRGFMTRDDGWSPVPAAELCRALGERGIMLQRAAMQTPEGLMLTPRRTNTDGFFISMLRR
jgi:16S rRNA (cytosine967-C5)-methyltransferase